MPRNPDLNWVDLTDFSGGVWSVDSAFLMPATAFQTMTDCYPRAAGGVRAFFKPTALTVSGLTSTGIRPIWLESYSDAAQTTYLLLTVNVSTGRLTAWTRTESASSWTSSKVFTAPASAAKATQAQACQYVSSSGVAYFAVGVGQYDGGADTGIWLYKISDGTWSLMSGTQGVTGVMVAMYQNRLLGRSNSGYATANRLVWTDPGGITFPAANFIDLGAKSADISAAISAMVPFNPSNLLVATATAGWYAIEGDIDDPIVTEMGTSHSPNIAHGQRVTTMDSGVVFLDPNTGLYVATNQGGSFERLNPNLTPFNPGIEAGFGMENWRDFLFAPGGRVQHLPTQAWFTLSEGTGSNEIDFYYAQRYDADAYGSSVVTPGLIALQYQDAFKMLRYVVDEAVGSSAGRYETYTVKTAPLRTPDARQMTVEEVEVWVNSYHASSTVAVTVNGTTQTSAAIPVGKSIIPLRFRQRGSYLDVQVVPNSNVTGYEAPIIEAIRVGARKDGHGLYG